MNEMGGHMRGVTVGEAYDCQLKPGSWCRALRRTVLSLLILAAARIPTEAQYQFRTEVNPDGTLTVYKGAACPGEVLVIPNTIEGWTVSRIGSSAFAGCGGLTSVTIEDGVTHIEDRAFAGCTDLTRVVIPDSVATLGLGAFAWTGLTTVTVPGGIRVWRGAEVYFGNVIVTGSFRDCSQLTNVTLAIGVPFVGRGAFANCTRLRTVTIPNVPTSHHPNRDGRSRRRYGAV